MIADLDDRLLEPGDHANTARVFVGEGIQYQVRDRSRQHAAASQYPLADAGEVRRRGKRAPACIGALRQHLQHRRLDQVLESPVGGQAHGQAKGQQCESAVRLEAMHSPGEEQPEIRNHGTDDKCRQQSPPHEQAGKRQHHGGMGNGERHQRALFVISSSYYRSINRGLRPTIHPGITACPISMRSIKGPWGSPRLRPPRH